MGCDFLPLSSVLQADYQASYSLQDIVSSPLFSYKPASYLTPRNISDASSGSDPGFPKFERFPGVDSGVDVSQLYGSPLLFDKYFYSPLSPTSVNSSRSSETRNDNASLPTWPISKGVIRSPFPSTPVPTPLEALQERVTPKSQGDSDDDKVSTRAQIDSDEDLSISDHSARLVQSVVDHLFDDRSDFSERSANPVGPIGNRRAMSGLRAQLVNVYQLHGPNDLSDKLILSA